jgi:enoyl-CoA hydratase/carnithine racemase
VLLLRGAGRAFCAGADLKERQAMSPPARLAHNRAINAAVDALAATEIPTVAVLNGLALGGGCELALACDIRIAAASAIIGLTEARIGAIPGAGGTQRLPRLVGIAAALDMMLSGEPVGAARAEAIGLVQAAVPDADLDAHVLRYATLLASRSPRTARLLKQVVRGGMATSLDAGLAQERAALAEVFASTEYAEGLQAFAERRDPVFSNDEPAAERLSWHNGSEAHA